MENNTDSLLSLLPYPATREVRNLIGEGVNSRDFFGVTPLMRAAMLNKDCEIINEMLFAGAEVETADIEGMTPLHWASRCNRTPDVIRVLLKAGANIHSLDKRGYSPLMHAVKHNKNPRVIRVLIEKGAEITAEIWELIEGRRKELGYFGIFATDAIRGQHERCNY